MFFLVLKILLIISLFLFFGTIEYFFPAEKGQPMLKRMRNIGFVAIFVLTSFLWHVITAGPGAFAHTLPSGIPHPFTLFLALFLGDICFYWYHRLEHGTQFFWKLHRLHHSDEHLNVTSAFRTSWIEVPFLWLATTFPVALFIEMNTATILVLLVVGTIWLCFTHANIRLEMGPLTKHLCGPQLHRLHHAHTFHDQGHNFAQFFPCIDVLFGTYRAPDPGEFPPTGIATHISPKRHTLSTK